MMWERLRDLECIISKGLTSYPEYVLLITGAYFSIFSTIFYKAIYESSTVISDKFQISIIILGCGLLVISAVALWLSYHDKKTLIQYSVEIDNLKEQIEALSNEDLYHQDVALDIVRFINQYIGDCVLNFGGQKNKSDRISLYVHDSDGFFPIARYSANPTLNKIRRKKYPQDQGAIHHAFNNGIHLKRYPDPNSDPDGYYKILEEFDHIPRDQAEQFTMKPRLIFGFRIGDSKNPVAVFIIESSKTNRFSNLELEELFQLPAVKICIDIILKLELPNPNIGDEWEEKDTNHVVNNE